MTDARDRIHEVLQRTAQRREQTAVAAVDAHEQVARLSAELDDARAVYRRTWADATAAGWSDSELKELGLESPDHQPRRRRSRKPAARTPDPVASPHTLD